MSINDINNRAIVIGIRPENLGAEIIHSGEFIRKAIPDGPIPPASLDRAFQGWEDYRHPPLFFIDLNEGDVIPPLLGHYEEDHPLGSAFTKRPGGVPQGSSQDEALEQYQQKRREIDQKRQEDYQRELEEQREREAAANKPKDSDYPDGSEDKMPNPDSGDPGGPRSLDPYLYQPQPLYINAIAKSMIR